MAMLIIKGLENFPLEADKVSIGRDPSNMLHLDDNKVSRMHCRIDKVSGLHNHPTEGKEGGVKETFWIQDLGSSNGTIVNGDFVQRKELKDGDEIKLGNTQMLFTKPSPAASRGTTPLEKQIEGTERESLMRDQQNLRTLYKVNSIIRSVFDVDELLKKILDVVLDVIEAERGFIMLKDDETSELIPKATRNRNVKEITISKTIVNKIFETGESILSQDAMLDERFASGKSVFDYHIRSCLCVPLKSKDKILGIIHVDNRVSAHSFTEGDLELLSAIGSEAGVVVENAKLYEENLRAERLAAIGETIAGLSHYIKNILTGVEGGATLIEMGLDKNKPELIRKGWGVVRSSDEKISELVLNMLDYSKDRRPVREKSNINNIVKEVVSLMEEKCKEKSVKVETVCDESIPEINVDPTGMHRAILNLVTNAIDAVVCHSEERSDEESLEEGKGQITLTTSILPLSLRITVSDNGPGIPKENVPHIFDLFHSTKGAKGTGLGLAVTKKIVEEHNGEIRVSSRVGHGTTFTIIIPQIRFTDGQTCP